MTRYRFIISESGYVYRRMGGKRSKACLTVAAFRLGHISHLLEEQTTLGQLVRRWWASYLMKVQRQCASASLDQPASRPFGERHRGSSDASRRPGRSCVPRKPARLYRFLGPANLNGRFDEVDIEALSPCNSPKKSSHQVPHEGTARLCRRKV